MSFRPDRPHDDLPLLPPEADVETRQILKACVPARAALATLKAAGGLIPDQRMLINSIPILEARASSAIENIVTTADKLFRFADEGGEGADPATREALRYRSALNEGARMLKRKPLSTSLAVQVCRTIKGIDLDIRKVPGTALLSEREGRVVYTPPGGEARIRDKLANWERYVHAEDDLDPLIRMAVMHYQFQAIHPFVDGNGRTGRVLNLLFLVEQGLLDIPVLYLSRYIIKRKGDYYRGLLRVTTHGAWEAWILYMLDAVRETATWTSAKIEAIRTLLDRTAATIKHKAPKIYSRELAEILFVQPYCRIGNLVDADIAKRQSASVYLKTLANLGILQERKAGREKLFVNPALMKLLMETKD